MTNTQNALRAAVPLAALALLLTACGPENEDPAAGAAGAAGASAAATTAPGATGAPSATGGSAGTAGTSGTAGTAGTAGAGGNTPNAVPSAATSGNPIGGAGGGAGSGKIGYDNPLATTATGSYLGKTKADVTPVSVVKGTAAEVAPYNFKPAELDGKTPYYVTVSFTNRTGGPLTDEYFMMRFKVKSDTAATGGVLPAPTVLKSIPQCDSGKKPGTLADGQTQQQCAVYLVPTNTPPKFLVFGSVLDTEPLIWKAG
ncbi:hypothetical protein ACIF6L_16910 [Kitasatospora sp. NPDC086009]|uniref:hypothetical protein n=1 Tax=unclassified Kitasatospora TaxID=2633591 RepID=UPI0037C82836